MTAHDEAKENSKKAWLFWGILLPLAAVALIIQLNMVENADSTMNFVKMNKDMRNKMPEQEYMDLNDLHDKVSKVLEAEMTPEESKTYTEFLKKIASNAATAQDTWNFEKVFNRVRNSVEGESRGVLDAYMEKAQEIHSKKVIDPSS